MPTFDWKSKRAALIIAHPGHELRVHHWLATARPVAMVLTDGSGRTSQSRLPVTRSIIEQSGSRVGPLFGRFTDASIYAFMLAGEREIFLEALQAIADCLLSEGIDYVVGDALEGYNTSHEVCRYLAGAACEVASRLGNRQIRNFDFLLTGDPNECPEALRAEAICIRLDEAAISAKLKTAEAYAELQVEVQQALQKYGRSGFATEWLRPVANDAGLYPTDSGKPFYEAYGEQQRAAGHYRDVILRDAHLLPLARCLWESALKSKR